MKRTLLTYTLIKLIVAFSLFGLSYLIFDFYTAQNIIVLMGAIYISVAWIKYLRKDNFLKKRNLSDDGLDEDRTTALKVSILSYLIPCLFILIVALL